MEVGARLAEIKLAELEECPVTDEQVEAARLAWQELANQRTAYLNERRLREQAVRLAHKHLGTASERERRLAAEHERLQANIAEKQRRERMYVIGPPN